MKPYYTIDYEKNGMWLRAEKTTNNDKAYKHYEKFQKRHKRLGYISDYGGKVLKIN